MKEKILFLVVGMTLGGTIGRFLHGEGNEGKDSQIENKIKCKQLGDKREEEGVFHVTDKFYSPKLDTCVVGELMWTDDGEYAYGLFDTIAQKSIGFISKEKYGEKYYKVYLDKIKELE